MANLELSRNEALVSEQADPVAPVVIRRSIEIPRYLAGTRRYCVRADFLSGESIRIWPVEITETTINLPQLSWCWRAEPFEVEITNTGPVRDLDCADEVLREWARETVSTACRPDLVQYPCRYCISMWPGKPSYWGNPALPCNVCADRYPWLRD